MDLASRRVVLESVFAPLFNAQGAVIAFFLLSGFVLADSLERGRALPQILQFTTRRIFRIHPPYVAAVLIAWAVSAIYTIALLAPDLSRMSQWFIALSLPPIAVSELIQSLLFPDPAFGQLSCGWTLEIEMIYSLVLPLLFWVATRFHWSGLVVLFPVPFAVDDSPGILFFGLNFALGIAVYLEWDRLVRWLNDRRTFVIGGIFLVSLYLFAAPQLLGWLMPFAGILTPDLHDPKSILLTTAGALGLMVLAGRTGLLQRFLETPPILWLGRVSYALYLLHFPVTLLCVHLVDAKKGLPGWALVFALVMSISLPLSAIFDRLIERPSIAAGNHICRKLAERMQTDALETRRES